MSSSVLILSLLLGQVPAPTQTDAFPSATLLPPTGGRVVQVPPASAPTRTIPPSIPNAVPARPASRSAAVAPATIDGPIYIIDETKNGKNGEKKNGDKNGDEEKKDEEEEKKDEGPNRLFPDPVFCDFKVIGWMYGTYNYNVTNASSRYNGPMTTNDQEGLYLNQAWLNFSRALDEKELKWGATFDVFFGNDYISSLARGFENKHARGWLPHWWNNQDYGIAIPQAYVEVGTTKTNLRVGHFYTLHGYMVVQAPSNFFGTFPYGFMMTNPYTHFGVQGNHTFDDQWSGSLALVNGWDALSRPVNAPLYMGQLKYTFKESKGWASTTISTGQEPENVGTGYGNRTLITNIIDYKATEKDELVLENNLLWQRNQGIGTDFSWSLIPYYFRKINDCWKAGIRYEIFYDPSGFISAERVGNQNNGPIVSKGVFHGYMHSITAGLNWFPNASKNLTIRPEIRYDFFNGNGPQPFSEGNRDHQIMMMVGALYQF